MSSTITGAGISAVQDGSITADDLATVAAGNAAPQRMMLTVAKASTSGTFIDFSPADGTGIPSWAKKVTVLMKGVSGSGTSRIMLQLGSSAVVTTGYVSSAGSIGTTTNNTGPSGLVTTGIVVDGYAPVTAWARTGGIVLYNMGGNAWVASGSLVDPSGGIATVTSGGSIDLSGVLDRIRITTVNGTETFDAGSVSLLIEG